MIQEAYKAGIDLEFMSGERLQEMTASSLDASSEVVAKAAELNAPRK